MKWVWSTAIVVVAVSSAAAAQSGKDMGKSGTGEMMTSTYTGCVESVNHGGTFMLTRIGEGDMATGHDDAMMKHDAPMKGDAMMKGDGSKGMGAPRAVVLTGMSNLKKHVGQKVSVTGSLTTGAVNTTRDDLGTLTVSSLKVVAKSCS